MARGAVSRQAVGVAGLLVGSALAQTQDVGDHAGACLGEGLGGETDGAQEIGLLRERGPQAGVLFVERVVAGHQGQHATGFQRVERLGEKEVMQREAHAVVVKPEIGEGHVADDGVNGSSGRRVSRKCSIRISWPGCSTRAIRPETVELHTDEAHTRRGVGDEVADATARLSTVASAGTPRCRSAACMAWMTTGEV